MLLTGKIKMATKKGWYFAPPKKPKGKKLNITEKSEIEEVFKKKIDFINKKISEQQKTIDINYIDEVFLSWYRSFLYVCCRHVRLDGQVTESKMGRICFHDNGTASTAYMRHTQQWWTINENLSFEDATKEVLNNEVYWGLIGIHH